MTAWIDSAGAPIFDQPATMRTPAKTSRATVVTQGSATRAKGNGAVAELCVVTVLLVSSSFPRRRVPATSAGTRGAPAHYSTPAVNAV
ncbi:hypothetical protein GCM10010106_07020 [Thermopolyspora flexuosa]|nr:hypothetical protein GCM10010106_07020 [Thermopolyspora flexuosa]